jgi:NosL
MKRRAFFRALLCFACVACGKARTEARCNQCGMKIEAKSSFAAELRSETGSRRRFDTPRCALEKSIAEGRRDALWVQTFYDVVWVRADDALAFVKGSDVIGPMGPDFVPVEATHEAKFLGDHGGKIVRLNAIDAALLSGAGAGTSK